MPVRARKLTDHGLFTDYRPDPDKLLAGYRERVGALSFARDAEGRDFYEHVYGWTGEGYTPVSGRSYAYVEDGTGRVTQIVHDDEDAFPSNRTLLAHPVRDGVSLRLVTFMANRDVKSGMVWDGHTGFSQSKDAS